MKELLSTLIFIVFFFGKPLAQNKEYVNSLIKKSWNQSQTSIDSAKFIIDEAISIAKTKKFDEELAAGLCYRGVYQDMQGESDKALELFVRAVNIQKRIGDDKGLGFTFTNMGLLHYAQYDYDNAIKYVNKSLEIQKKLKDRDSEAGCYSNLAIFYLNKEDPIRGLQYTKEAAKIYRELKDSSGLITILSTRGRIFLDEGNTDRALENFLEVKSILKAFPTSYYDRITNFISIGTAYESLGELDSAKSVLTEALDLSLILGNPEREQYCYETLRKVSIAQGDYKSAYDYLKRFYELRNKLLAEEKTKSINELQVKYDVAEKDKEISDQQARQSTFIAVLILLISIILFLASVYYLKRRLAASLKERNNAVEHNLKQKEIMISEIHHRIKNNFQLVSSILGLKANSMSHPEAIKALSDSKEKIFSMAQLHKHLYSSNSFDEVNMHRFTSDLVKGITGALKIEGQDYFYDLQIENKIIVEVENAVSIGLIVSELVNNIFKHSVERDDEIEFRISLKESKEDEFELVVSDSGKGCTMTKSEMILKSFGMKMVNSLIKQLNGQWEITNRSGLNHAINFKLI